MCLFQGSSERFGQCDPERARTDLLSVRLQTGSSWWGLFFLTVFTFYWFYSRWSQFTSNLIMWFPSSGFWRREVPPGDVPSPHQPRDGQEHHTVSGGEPVSPGGRGPRGSGKDQSWSVLLRRHGREKGESVRRDSDTLKHWCCPLKTLHYTSR